MENRKLLLGFCMLICGLAIVLLATGSPILLYPLGGEDGLPIGNLITWFGFIAFPTSFYLGIAKIRASKGWKRVFEILILFAILWWPIAYFLSGNLTNTFTEKADFQGGYLAMRIFWFYSIGLPVLCLLLLLIFLLSTKFRQQD